jgi:formylglycine-generating enzyme required for sulfatase activity
MVALVLFWNLQSPQVPADIADSFSPTEKVAEPGGESEESVERKGTDSVSPTEKAAEAGPESQEPAGKITNSIGMELVLIPAGEFSMGSPDTEEDHEEDEMQHRVKLTRPFYMGVYEVTQAEYEQVMGHNPSYFSSAGAGADQVQGNMTDRFPVEQVSWEQAVVLCAALSRKEGQRYRLPTEAEWEYACRAGSTWTYSTAAVPDSELGFVANWHNTLDRTTDVGSYAVNAFGLYDMHGNVEEWCQDWYGKDYYAKSPQQDPDGPETGESRVIRGGSWHLELVNCRSPGRAYRAPTDRDNTNGFRVVREP